MRLKRGLPGAGTDLRQAARDQSCILCGSVGTTVLHHLRVDLVGIGRKCADVRGLEVCAGCHRYLHGEGIADHRLMLIGHLRQIDRWLCDGRLKLS